MPMLTSGHVNAFRLLIKLHSNSRDETNSHLQVISETCKEHKGSR